MIAHKATITDMEIVKSILGIGLVPFFCYRVGRACKNSIEEKENKGNMEFADAGGQNKNEKLVGKADICVAVNWCNCVCSVGNDCEIHCLYKNNFDVERWKEEKNMKKSNSEAKQGMTLTDDKGNYIEFIGSKESRMRGLVGIIGAYCQRIRLAMKENQ